MQRTIAALLAAIVIELGVIIVLVAPHHGTVNTDMGLTYGTTPGSSAATSGGTGHTGGTVIPDVTVQPGTQTVTNTACSDTSPCQPEYGCTRDRVCMPVTAPTNINTGPAIGPAK